MGDDEWLSDERLSANFASGVSIEALWKEPSWAACGIESLASSLRFVAAVQNGADIFARWLASSCEGRSRNSVSPWFAAFQHSSGSESGRPQGPRHRQACKSRLQFLPLRPFRGSREGPHRVWERRRH